VLCQRASPSSFELGLHFPRISRFSSKAIQLPLAVQPALVYASRISRISQISQISSKAIQLPLAQPGPVYVSPHYVAPARGLKGNSSGKEHI